MANHDWDAVDPMAAAAGITSSRAASTGILVQPGDAWQCGGCASRGGFGGGAFLALPVLLVAAVLRRHARRR